MLILCIQVGNKQRPVRLKLTQLQYCSTPCQYVQVRQTSQLEGKWWQEKKNRVPDLRSFLDPVTPLLQAVKLAHLYKLHTSLRTLTYILPINYGMSCSACTCNCVYMCLCVNVSVSCVCASPCWWHWCLPPGPLASGQEPHCSPGLQSAEQWYHSAQQRRKEWARQTSQEQLHCLECLGIPLDKSHVT